MEALSGPRKGSEGSGDSCWTLSECGGGQFELVDRGRLGEAWRPSQGRERGRRGVGIHAGPFVSGVRGSLGL